MMASMARIAVVGGAAGAVTVSVMAGMISYQNSKMLASQAQIDEANRQIQARAALMSTCQQWSTNNNLYLEKVDQYNMMRYTCNGSTLLWVGSYINSQCYGLTPPANTVGPRPSGC